MRNGQNVTVLCFGAQLHHRHVSFQRLLEDSNSSPKVNKDEIGALHRQVSQLTMMLDDAVRDKESAIQERDSIEEEKQVLLHEVTWRDDELDKLRKQREELKCKLDFLTTEAVKGNVERDNLKLELIKEMKAESANAKSTRLQAELIEAKVSGKDQSIVSKFLLHTIGKTAFVCELREVLSDQHR